MTAPTSQRTIEAVMLGSVAVATLQVFFHVGFAPPLVEFLARPLFGDGGFLREDVRIHAAVFGLVSAGSRAPFLDGPDQDPQRQDRVRVVGAHSLEELSCARGCGPDLQLATSTSFPSMFPLRPDRVQPHVERGVSQVARCCPA